jgi:hypothetical protein
LKPRARTEGVIVRRIGDEVVVYDRERHLAHCLNRTAAVVFQSADGRRTVTELQALLGAESGCDVHEDVVWTSLDRLAEAHLLEGDATPSRLGDHSRREALRQVGLGMAVLAPVIASLIVPTPAEAANTCIPASACTDQNIGQPCHNGNPGVECLNKTCQGPSSCP